MIDEQVAHFRDLRREFEWKLYSHDFPQDLGALLVQAGLQPGPVEAVMIFDLASNRESWGGSSGVQRVRTSEDLQAFRSVAERVFNKDYALTTGELEAAIKHGSEEHIAFVAHDLRGNAVAIGRVYTSPRSPFAGLYGGGTLKEERGKGHYRALVAARADFARMRGAKYLMVDALPTSRPILERMGFDQVATTQPFQWTLSG